jgi:hypothetical protein
MTIPSDSAILSLLWQGFMPPFFVLRWARGIVANRLGMAAAVAGVALVMRK